MTKTKKMPQQQRRIEIVGLCALNPNQYTIGDLSIIFKIDEESLKKDFKALRSEGIAIHQRRGQGISIQKVGNPEILEIYLQQYLILSNADSKKDRLLSQMVKKKGLFAVGLIVALQKGIREEKKIQIDYLQNKGEQPIRYLVDPLMLFQREGLWRLLARFEGAIMQFHIAKIISVVIGNKKFTPPAQHIIDEQFKYSWDTWISGDKIPIQLQMTDFWAERFGARPAVDDQRITQRGKDNHLFEGTINTIEEIARWIAGRNGDVIALSPISLRKQVKEFARDCLKKHGK